MRYLIFFIVFTLLSAPTAGALAFVINDPLYYEQTYLQQINVSGAWARAQGEGAIVAVLDSGVDIAHPELANQIWRNPNEIAGDGIDNDNNGYIDDINGWDFVTGDNDPRPDVGDHYDIGSVSHGTATAGLIAATSNNNEGIVGVAWKAKIMPLRILNSEGGGTVTRLITAIEYAVRHEADVINLSLVGYEYSPELKRAINWAYDQGVIVVAAAGNTTDDDSKTDLKKAKAYPVCYGNDLDENLVTGVGSVDGQDNLSRFSNYGGGCVDVMAPGENLISLNYFDPEIGDFSDGYRRELSGTSFATALVSGAVALMRSYQPEITPQEVVTVLRASAVDLGDEDYGGGLLNIDAALALLVPGAPGKLVKIDNHPAVYYVNGSSKHLFSTENTYWSWYSGTWANQGVMTVSQSEFDALSTGANITVRSGMLVKFDNSPKVYIVGEDRMLYNITEDAAIAWYGSNYSTKVNIIQSSFEANYTKSSTVLTSSDKVPNGTLVKYAGSEDVYLIADGKKRMVTDEGFTANKFKDSAVLVIPVTMTFSAGSSVIGAEAGIWSLAGAGSTGSTDGGSITTPGAEGTITVSLASKPAGVVKVQEGQNKVALLGFEVEADNSDVLVQRVKLDFATTSSVVWKKVLETVYLYDGSTLLATVDLDDAVNENGTFDSITITGFSALVKKDQTKVFTVKADIRSTIDSAYETNTYTIRLDNSGSAVRAIDGAGIDQYDGIGTTVTKDFTVEAPDVDSASLKLALATGNPSVRQMIATSGSDDDEIDEVETLRFTLEADDDDILLTDLVATTAKTGLGTATATTAYLYNEDGDLLDSASIVSTTGVATFDNVDYEISKDSKETFMIKVDIENAAATAGIFTTSVLAANVTSENSDGDAVTATGSAVGEALTVLDAGAEITLTSASVTKGATSEQGGFTTSTVTSVFTFKLKAVDGDVTFGTTASATPAFELNSGFNVYKNSVPETFLVASSTSYATNPSNTTSVTAGFTLADGNETTVTVTHVFEGKTVAGAPLALGSYAVGLEQIQYSVDGGATVTTNFMANEEAWRTSSVQLP
jgi:subtilisin family serine protease